MIEIIYKGIMQAQILYKNKKDIKQIKIHLQKKSITNEEIFWYEGG